MVRVRGGIWCPVGAGSGLKSYLLLRRITGMPFWNPLRSAAWLLAALAS